MDSPEAGFFNGSIFSRVCVCVCVMSAVHKEYGENKPWLWTAAQGASEVAGRVVRWRILEEQTSHGVWLGTEAAPSRSRELSLSL